MSTHNENEAIIELYQTHTPKELLADLKKNKLYAAIGTSLSFVGTSLTLNNYFGGFWAKFDLSREFEPQQLLFTTFALALGFLAAAVLSAAFRRKTRGFLGSLAIISLVTFNMTTESANGGDRAEAAMRQASIESPEFQTAKQMALNSTQTKAYTPSPELIRAEAKVGELNALMQRCTELHSKEKDINWCQRKPSRELATWQPKHQALLNAEQRQIQLLTTTSAHQSSAALAEMKALGRDEDNYNMMIRMLSRATGLTGFGANQAVSLFIIAIIMVCIMWVANNLGNLRGALRLYGLDTEGKTLKAKSRPTPPPIPQTEKAEKSSVPKPKPSRDQGTEEEQIEMPIPSPELSVPPAPPTKPERPTVPRHPNNRPEHRPETVGHPDSGAPKTENTQDTTVPEDTQRIAMIELLRAVNHGLIQKPSIRPARDILTAAKIGKNKEERENLARHFYEVEAQPEIIVPADTYGEKGKPFWQFAEGWTPDPSKYQKPEYSV